MCCLFGLIDYSGAFSRAWRTKVINLLSKECEVRGTDATGISYLSHGKLCVYKRPWPARKMRFNVPNDAYVIMGHTRMTTQGSEKQNQNNHPFAGTCGGTCFTLAHNGMLRNDKTLRRERNLPKTNIETDSYISVQLLEQENTLDFSSLKNMAEAVEGSFVFTVLDQNCNLYLVKGDNPICIYHFYQQGFYLYASTPEILNRALKKLRLHRWSYSEVPMQAGDILQVNSKGFISSSSFDYKKSSMYLDYDWGNYPPWRNWGSFLTTNEQQSLINDEYLAELESVATAYGYAPEDVQDMIDEGLSFDEIEEMLYCSGEC
jgi:glucosamine--fructose-6-phosphate aminotransferase (isomerizing)